MLLLSMWTGKPFGAGDLQSARRAVSPSSEEEAASEDDKATAKASQMFMRVRRSRAANTPGDERGHREAAGVGRVGEGSNGVGEGDVG